MSEIRMLRNRCPMLISGIFTVSKYKSGFYSCQIKFYAGQDFYALSEKCIENEYPMQA